MAERLYYDTQDIMDVLKVGKRKANEIMHMFDARGELFRCGKTMRVRKTYFEAWLNRLDGPERRRKILDKEFQGVGQSKARAGRQIMLENS